jgi:peptidyl-prolyl cis-trans isomerase SurA
MSLPSVAAQRALHALAASGLASMLLFGPGAALGQPRNPPEPLSGDYIAAVVNQELVTAGEVERRIQRARVEAGRGNLRLPPDDELRRQVFDSLIDERVILSLARESGMRIDDTEVDRAMQSIAAQNQLSLDGLRSRLAAEGIDFGRFRANVRDQMMVERLREREVIRRIVVTDDEIDQFLQRQRAARGGEVEINLAQIMVTVPEGADAATLAARRARIEAALARVRAGEDFAAVAREVSEDGNRERGGVIGLRPLSRLPELFVEGSKALQPGQVSPELLRSGAGFHVLKLLERRDGAAPRVTQTRARHVLLRPSPQLSAEAATRRLAEYRQQIASGQRSFEEIARQYSEDSSAAEGGDLGWAAPGTMVPEFEQAMNALPLGGVSAPVISRFGAHLIQVLERREVEIDPRQLREQARNVLREQKFEQAYVDWTKELRSRAYVELREPPQ